MNHNARILTIVMSLAAAAAGGCTWPGQSADLTAPDAAAPQNDACSEMLHDLCGELLAYYADHGQLPPTLADLNKRSSGASGLALVCPVTRVPYIYTREGLAVRGWPGRLILYEAAACHDGRRWGILAEMPQQDKPVFFRVVRPPEEALKR